ncbi:uncharacterized protein LOC134814626 [Bolinopsis microptera]|uniref:uncharacterized protein LOC134814626 n=1 Tax=Bolinopsis microptera TaxID=2820187 RepID=UPI00307A9D64
MEGEKPWDSTYQYQCKKKMFEEHKEELGESRAVALANVWANYHFLNCSYPPEALAAINSWGPPPRDAMYEEKMKELKDREAIMAGDKPTSQKKKQRMQMHM